MVIEMFLLIIAGFCLPLSALDTLHELGIVDAEKNIVISHIDAVKKIKASRRESPDLDEHLNQALIEAIETTHHEVIELLLKSGVQPNDDFVTDIDACALFKALQHDDPSILAKLISHGVDINLQDKRYGDSALIYAAKNRMHHICNVLVEHHARIDQENRAGNTALLCAVKNRDLGCVQILLDAGAQPNTPDQQRKTPLMHACALGATDIAELLLAHNAELDDQDAYDCSPLMYACQRKNPELIRLLICAGAQLDLLDHQDENVIDYLIQDIADVDERKALLTCFFSAWRERIIKEVREKNGEISIFFHLTKIQELIDLLTYGSFALEDECKMFVSDNLPWILLDYQTDDIITNETLLPFMKELIYNFNRHDITRPLYEYLQPGFNVPDNEHEVIRQRIVGYIREHDYDAYLDMAHACLYDENDEEEMEIDSYSLPGKLQRLEAATASAVLNHHKNGKLLLSQLSTAEELELLPLLIEKGISLDARNTEDQTAIMQAAEQRNFGCVRLLIHAGADITLTDIEDRTILEHLLEIDTVRPTPLDDLNSIIQLAAERHPALLNRTSTHENLSPLIRLMKNFEPIDLTHHIKTKLRRLIQFMLSQGAHPGIETLYGTIAPDIAHHMNLEEVVQDLCTALYTQADESDPFLDSAQALNFCMENTPNRNPEFLKEVSDLQKRLFNYQHTKIKQSRLQHELTTLSTQTAHQAIDAIAPQTLVDSNGAGSFMLYETYQYLCMSGTISKMPGCAEHTPERMRIVHPSLGRYLQELKKRPLTPDDYPLIDPITKDGFVISVGEMDELLHLTEHSPRVEILASLVRDKKNFSKTVQELEATAIDKDETLALLSQEKVNLHTISCLISELQRSPHKP